MDYNNLTHEELMKLIEEDNKDSIKLRNKLNKSLNKLPKKDRDFIRGEYEKND